MRENIKKYSFAGFTLVEILIVVMILSIAMGLAVPMLSSASSLQAQSAGDMITADLEYARSMAISRGQHFGLSFDATNDCYSVVDQNGVVVKNPVVGGNYAMNFRTQRSLSNVDVTAANFDGTSTIQFDSLGGPLNADGAALNNNGIISIAAGGVTVTITIQSLTGYIQVQ